MSIMYADETPPSLRFPCHIASIDADLEHQHEIWFRTLLDALAAPGQNRHAWTSGEILFAEDYKYDALVGGLSDSQGGTPESVENAEWIDHFRLKRSADRTCCYDALLLCCPWLLVTLCWCSWICITGCIMNWDS